jgi:hypothetical protein
VCVAAVLALAGCQSGAATKAVVKPTGTAPGVVTVTAASHVRTLSDCRDLTPALCYGVRQFLTAYGIEPLLSRGIDGRGQSVVLLEFSQPGGETTSDIRRDLALFDGIFGLPDPKIQVITRFAGASAPYLAGGEEAGDAEMVHAVAPAAVIRIILLPPGDGDLHATAARFAAALRLAPSLGGVVAITAGAGERCAGAAEAAELNAALQADEDQHATVIASSGDNGAAATPCPGAASSAYVKGVNLPASDPLVLAAGGTNLQADRLTGSYIGETAWTQPGARLPAGAPTPPASPVLSQELLPKASNGGFSILFPRPAYQDGIPASGTGAAFPTFPPTPARPPGWQWPSVSGPGTSSPPPTAPAPQRRSGPGSSPWPTSTPDTPWASSTPPSTASAAAPPTTARSTTSPPATTP